MDLKTHEPGAQVMHLSVTVRVKLVSRHAVPGARVLRPAPTLGR